MVRFAVCLTAIAVAVPARAQVAGGDLGFSLIGHVQFGKAKPMLIFNPSAPFAGVQAVCQRSDGHKVAIGIGNLALGKEKRVVVPQGKGVFAYQCLLSGRQGKQAFAGFQLDFQVMVGEPPKIAIQPSDVDEAGRKITVRLSEPAGKIEVDLTGDDGKPIDNVSQLFKGEAPGTPLTVTWKQADSEVLGSFQLRAYDPAGFWSGIESVTFVDIPHEDVVFESGKWDIRPSEEAKLLAPLDDIQKALKKVQGVLEVSLYIGGYTDTVGQPTDNLELSRKRALAIGKWFGDHGVKAAIHGQGFGETVLKVPTPDNTDEVRNRRASYVLSTQVPPASRGFPARNWHRVR
jgi:outer membrane protein OmpA-like peptidoglycan-associated protein